MTNDSKFIVFCEKVKDDEKYSVYFTINKQLLERIKVLPKAQRTWSPTERCWVLSPVGLYTIILGFRKSEKIFFNFGGEENKKIFLELVQKEDELSRKSVNDLKLQLEKNEKTIELKQHFEDNYKQYEQAVLEKLKPDVSLYRHQIVAAHFLDFVGNALLSLEMGLGKMNPLYTKILTPSGWTTMGKISIGDKVIGSDGNAHNVTGVFPQGKKDIYRVFFNDGTFSDCGEEHLWAVNTPTRLWRSRTGIKKFPNRILTTRQIMDEGLYLKNGNRKHYIPIVEPIHFDKKNQLIDPYLLGCLLGDGGLTTSSPSFTSIDDEILNEVRLRIPFSCKLVGKQKDYIIVRKKELRCKSNLLVRDLKKYSLLGTNSYTKFIPSDYKFGSIEQRLELLQGILDTDGHIFKDGMHIEITLASKQLIDDVQFIVQSLGGIARLKDKWIYYKGEKRLYYRLGIKLPPQFVPFKLSRKIERYKPVSKYLPARAMSKIEYIGEHEAQCISVDAPDHLYVTDHCILTHNTLCSIAYAEMKGFNKVFVITPNSLKYNFYNEVIKFTNSNAFIVGNKKNMCELEDAKYVIFNYEYFNSSDFDVIKNKMKALGFKKVPNCIICDESHRLKNTSSNTFKNFKKLFSKTPSKIFLSGTPAPNKVSELYSVLNQISPLEFATKQAFFEYYCGMKFDKEYMTWEHVNPPKLEELFHKLSAHTFRKRKIDVLDLPEKTYQKIIIEMNDKQADKYSDIERGVVDNMIFGTLHQTKVNPLTVMTDLRQYSASMKIKPIAEIIERLIEEGEKVVIVDMYKESLYELHKLFPEISAVHTGDQSVEERNEIVQDFQNPNGKCKVFLGSVQTCNYGLTLTASNKLIIITLPFSVGEYDQVSDRLHRIGQMYNVTIYLPTILDTIDEKVFDLIEAKRVEIVKAIDNIDHQTIVSISVLNDLMSMLKKKYVR